MRSERPQASDADPQAPGAGSQASGADEVVRFWREAGPSKWFAKDADFDARFAARFRDAHFRAAGRELEHWLAGAESALALIILLDQYPRNAFRGTAHMYATDGLALHYARRALAAGHRQRLDHELQNFMCLPLMHAEDRDAQVESLALYTAHLPDSLSWARDHHDIIQRFGRFPHRNAALGRDTTAEEQRFLDEGGFAG